MRRDLHRGFTLMELLVVTALVVLIATLAAPSFRAYGLRSNRAAAKTALMELASRQEAFRADRRAYATHFVDLGLAAESLYVGRSGEVLAAPDARSTYRVTLATSPDAFELVASPMNAQSADTGCGMLSLRSDGRRSASGAQGAGCWRN